MSTIVATRLKAATTAQHQRTEEAMPTKALLDGTLSTEAYAKLLTDQFRIYQSIENHLAASLVPYPTLSRFFEKKSPWLAEDLGQLGVPVPAPLPSQHPVKGLPHSVGMLYVMEGSMLGGQVILKSLRKNEHLVGLTHRFYQGNGTGTGQRWREFVALCEDLVAEEKVPKAVEGAIYTFEFFRENLDGG